MAGCIEERLGLVPTMAFVVDWWTGGISGSSRPTGNRGPRKGADREAAEERGVLTVGREAGVEKLALVHSAAPITIFTVLFIFSSALRWVSRIPRLPHLAQRYTALSLPRTTRSCELATTGLVSARVIFGLMKRSKQTALLLDRRL